MNFGPTLGSRTSTYSTPTTKPPSQNAATLTSMQVARVQLAMSAQLPAVKFLPLAPTKTRTSGDSPTIPTGGLTRPGSFTPPSGFGDRPSRSSTTPPDAPSEVLSDIEHNLEEAGTAAVDNGDPVVGYTPVATPVPQTAGASRMGSKILLGLGIVVGGFVLFRFLK